MLPTPKNRPATTGELPKGASIWRGLPKRASTPTTAAVRAASDPTARTGSRRATAMPPAAITAATSPPTRSPTPAPPRHHGTTIISRLAAGTASRTQATAVRARRQATATTAPTTWNRTNSHTKGVRDRSAVHVRRSRSTRSTLEISAAGVTTAPPTPAGVETPTRWRNVRLTSGRVARWAWWVDGEPSPAAPSSQVGDAARTPRWRLDEGVDALATSVHVPARRSSTAGRSAAGTATNRASAPPARAASIPEGVPGKAGGRARRPSPPPPTPPRRRRPTPTAARRRPSPAPATRGRRRSAGPGRGPGGRPTRRRRGRPPALPTGRPCPG